MDLIRSEVTRFVRKNELTPVRVYWPHGKSELESKEFVSLARSGNVLDLETQLILWEFDRPNWLDAQEGVTRGVGRFETIVNNYLKGERK